MRPWLELRVQPGSIGYGLEPGATDPEASAVRQEDGPRPAAPISCGCQVCGCAEWDRPAMMGRAR